MQQTINVDQAQEEYSGSALVNIDRIQFIDYRIVESQITSSNPAKMPLRHAGYLQYNLPGKFTRTRNQRFIMKILVSLIILLFVW
jgi:hypothetical protein